ncbi:hypothetical protein EDD11_009848 [Mortierella claussenii]|nr:hypothetical protein EDD11_009848 [Mortierella claussenii]
MIGLVSTSAIANSTDLLKVTLPIGVGLASAAYLTYQTIYGTKFSQDRSIPMVALRSGDKTHDAEFNEDQDGFLSRCEQKYGPVFNCYILNQHLTVISGPMSRELFMTEDFNFMDAVDDTTGVRAFFQSIIKSNKHLDNQIIHEVIRDNVSPNLPLFTPRVVAQLKTTIDEQIGYCEGKLFETPVTIFQDMIAGAMASVFMGPELAKDRRVLDTFIQCNYDFGELLGRDSHKRFWHTFTNRAKYGMLNPLHKHIATLVECATPIILERRRQEAQCIESGVEYEPPLDVLQRLLDNFDKYHFVDLEDVCGHLMILVLASVHTTSDSSTNLCYYLAAFPEYVEPLYEEQKEVLAQISEERQALRQSKLESGTVTTETDFVGTDLDPEKDSEFSAGTLKRLVKMDSFVREVFRYRLERLSLPHTARKNVVLSNGMVITKGSKAIINTRSVHQDLNMQGEEPEDFRPFRFVGKSKSATKAAGDFLPFGMGRHACPGRFLAIQELKTVASVMVANYSKIEIQDPSKTKKALLSHINDPVDTGLIFTSRKHE